MVTTMWILLLCRGLLAAEPARGGELGVGTRVSNTEDMQLRGVQVMTRYRMGRVSLEGRAYASLVPERTTGLDETLARIIASQGDGGGWPTVADRASAAALLGVHPWALRGDGASPVLYVGAALRQREVRDLMVDGEQLSSQLRERRLAGGLNLGVGVEAEFGAWGARLTTLTRHHVATSIFQDAGAPADGLELVHDLTASVDVMYRFSGRRHR